MVRNTVYGKIRRDALHRGGNMELIELPGATDQLISGVATICFAGSAYTIQDAFGEIPLKPAEVYTRLWDFMVANDLILFLPGTPRPPKRPSSKSRHQE